MARNLGFLTKWSQYLGARTAEAMISMFEIDTNLETAAGLGRGIFNVDGKELKDKAWPLSLIGKTLYSLSGRRRERVLHNLRIAFPEKSEPQILDIAQGAFEHFAKLMFEIVQAPRVLSLHSWSSHVTFRNMEQPIEWMNAGKPAIVLTGHCGNWEMQGYVQALLGYPVNALARPIDNPLINDWLLGIREHRGMRIITKWDATDEMLRVLNTGESLGFVADQNAGNKGLFVPFFNRLASSYKSIGLLAINQNVPILCGYAKRIGPGFRYELIGTDFIYPEDWQDQEDPLFYVTARWVRAIETMVRESPDQYLWMHRRWKSRPRHELSGKPMPASLERRLASLPWMTDDQMEKLKHPVASLV